MEFVTDYMANYGLVGILGGLIIEALGVPFPGGVLLMLAGFLINQNRMDFYQVFGVALLGFNLGAMIAYYVGHSMGNLFFQSHWVLSRQQGVERARRWMQINAPACIIMGRFVPMMGNVMPYLAGASRLRWYQFLFYNFIFTMVWVSFNVSVGLIFGHKWPEIASYLNDRLPVLVVGLLLVYLIFKHIWKLIYGLKGEKI